MSVTSRIVERLLSSTKARRVYTYPGSPPRYVYEAMEEAGVEIVTTVREQHLLHLAQTNYFRSLEEGDERVPIVVVSADLGEAMLSQPLLAGSITCPCVVLVAEEAFPHVDNSANIAHQTDRATTHEEVANTAAIQRHENVAKRVLIEDERDLEKVDAVAETVKAQNDVGIIHLPLYAERGLRPEIERRCEHQPSLLSMSQFESRWNASKRPVLLVGRGTKHPTTRQRIQSIAENGGIPIATTLQMDGYFETNHVGRFGTIGTPAANEACYRSDLIVALGSSMNNLLTSYDPDAIGMFQAKTVQVEPNPRRRSVFVDSWFSKDVETAVEVLGTWRAESWFDPRYNRDGPSELVPKNVRALADSIREHCPETVVTLGVGNSMVWMAYALGPTIRKEVSRSGSMGEAVSGVAWGEPPILVLGDGEFEMDLSLITEAQYQDANPIICVVNNDRLGLVTERQESEFGRRLTKKMEQPIDYEQLGRAFAGVESFTATTPQEVTHVFEKAVSSDAISIIEIAVTERLSNELFDIAKLPRIDD